MTVETSRGAMDLEPSNGLEYAVWVMGLNAAMSAAAHGAETIATVPANEMLWSPQLFVMSN